MCLREIFLGDIELELASFYVLTMDMDIMLAYKNAHY